MDFIYGRLLFLFFVPRCSLVHGPARRRFLSQTSGAGFLSLLVFLWHFCRFSRAERRDPGRYLIQRVIIFWINVPRNKSTLDYWNHYHRVVQVFALQAKYAVVCKCHFIIFSAFRSRVCLSLIKWCLAQAELRRKYPLAYQLVQKLKPRHLSQKHFSEEEFYCNLHNMWGQPSLKLPLERKN